MADLDRIDRFRVRRPAGHVLSALGVLVAAGAFVALGYAIHGGGNHSDTTDQQPGRARIQDFPDASREPPAGWTGPVFRLSQDYPTTLPEAGPEPWMKYDFRRQTNDYLRAVLKYALEGNVEVDFRGQDNRVRKWYHAPWLHAGPNGREFIHGLTHERHSRPFELAPTQRTTADNWAVGMYNPRGGYVIGQVWKNRDDPDPREAKFPEGTVAFKLLFTTASLTELPFLKGSLEWQADINRSPDNGPRPTVRLLQLDVAVRDPRADSTTGWVFGTFIYDGDAAGKTLWDRLVPVGAMWGNDPDRLADQRPLQETVINPDARSLVQHVGYLGRLNGPIDNPISSCLSCHSTAEVSKDVSDPSTPEIPPNTEPATIASYFRNIPAETPFTTGKYSLDYSQQLQNGIANWAQTTQLRFPAPPSILGAAQPRILKRSGKVRITPATRG